MESIKTGTERKIILALDVEPNQAQAIIQELKDQIDIYKIGHRLFTALGPQVIEWVHSAGKKVFLDLKFYDIPKTVAEACRNAVRLKVWGLTVHASGGFDMMKETSQVVSQESRTLKVDKPLIFGVTVLTSFSDQDLKKIGVSAKAKAQVKRLALLAQSAGLDGVVASGQEISLIRKTCGKNFKLVIPGIRSRTNDKNDQKRIMTAEQALGLGADYLVVGRPILEAPDRRKTAAEFLNEIGDGRSDG